MLHYGAKTLQIREMNIDDLFLLRLKLLLRMATDYLGGCTFSPLRRQIMWDNACHIETESIALGRLPECREADLSGQSSVFIDDYFYRCANDLSVLIKLIAKGFPLDDRRKSVLQEKCEAIVSIQRTDYFVKFFPPIAGTVVSRKAQTQKHLASAAVFEQNAHLGRPAVGLRT